MNSNNLLAVEPENENDAARYDYTADHFKIFSSVEAATATTAIRIS